MNSIDVSQGDAATLDAGGHQARMPGALIYETAATEHLGGFTRSR
jgi:hypothetical protein